MKRIILIGACAMFLGATASFAQTQDTTRTRTKDTQTQSDQLKNRSHDQELKGWAPVNSTDVPASLRSTLGGSQYMGWDADGAKLYKNEAGDMYTLRMGDMTNQKIYYFDKNGKAVKKPN